MKIVVLDGYTLNPGDLSWHELEKLGDLTVFERTPKAEVLARCEGATIVLTNKTLIDTEIDQLPLLKYIGVLATGFNIVDVERAKIKGIVVANAPGYGTDSVVQLAFSLMMEFCLHVQKHSDAVLAGDWSQSADFSFWNYPLIEMTGKTVGIIGLGHIGSKVAAIAHAFGMKVLASGRRQPDLSAMNYIQWVEQEELLKHADFVTLHCPLTPETKGLIDEKKLRLMKKSAFLINTSRGPLIVEKDLARALNEDWISGAGLDVLSQEPPPAGNPLLHAKNCIITPHIAWATKEARMRLMDITVNNLRSYLKGNTINQVNK